MNKGTVLFLLAALLALAVGIAGLRSARPALAQTSPNYNLEWHVIGGGGQPLSSTHYVIHSTAGQGAASPPYSTSSSYAVSGGYWYKWFYRLYIPLVLKASP